MSINKIVLGSLSFRSLTCCFSATYFALLCFVAIPSSSIAQKKYGDNVYVSHIKTARFHRVESEFSQPIIELGSSDKLLFSFDDLSNGNGDFSYRLVHCRADWTVSNLVSSEYIEGFDSAPLRDFDNSINTLTTFTHYSLEIPNDDMKLTKSGNYILMVFENGDFEKLVVTRRFRVYENLVTVSTKLQRPVIPLLRERGQEIDFTIQHPNLTINDAQRDVKVLIEQNGRADNAISGLKPVFQRENELEYAFDEGNVFLGGKEFRKFNIQNIKFQTLEVESIYYADDVMNFKLNPVGSRFAEKYSYEEDLNGNYAISIESVDDNDLEADYVWVHFALKAEKPLSGGNVYVFGALSDWQIRPDYKMKFDYARKQYEVSLLLKQGFYNYLFVFYDEEKKQIDSELFEGSSYETENDYYIYVYHYDWDADYDRLVGVTHLNSVRKL